MARLEILPTQTHTVEAGEIEEYELADVDGTLQVNGTLKLIDDPVSPGHDIGSDPINLPVSLDLPVGPLNMRTMELGLGVFLIGILGLLLGAAAFLRNYAAGIMWSISLFALLASGLLGIGLELFWAMIAATVLLLIAGMVARWIV